MPALPRTIYRLRRSSPTWLAQNDPEVRVPMKYPGRRVDAIRGHDPQAVAHFAGFAASSGRERRGKWLDQPLDGPGEFRTWVEQIGSPD